MPFRIPDYHRLRWPFPEPSATTLGPISGSYNPDPRTKKTERKVKVQVKVKKNCLFSVPIPMPVPVFFVLGSVWALPPSLAATEGISLEFSSSGY